MHRWMKGKQPTLSARKRLLMTTALGATAALCMATAAAKMRVPQNPLDLHPRGSDAVAVAGYQGVKADAWRKQVQSAFERAGFALKQTRKGPGGVVAYRFEKQVALSQGPRNVEVEVRTDGQVDAQGRCVACFLRLADVQGLDAPARLSPGEVRETPAKERLTALPWLDQYTLSRAIFPALDQAYADMRTAGQAWQMPNMPFRYEPRWRGDSNVHQNAYAGQTPAQLKALIVGAWTAAGFVLVKELPVGTNEIRLEFAFPMSKNSAEGVAYPIRLVLQTDAQGLCQTCETQDEFNPHQSLPPAGLAGMRDRLSLQSRFSAARKLAYDKLKAASEGQLRSGSTFLTPPEPAALGSPAPRVLPPAVT